MTRLGLDTHLFELGPTHTVQGEHTIHNITPCKAFFSLSNKLTIKSAWKYYTFTAELSTWNESTTILYRGRMDEKDTWMQGFHVVDIISVGRLYRIEGVTVYKHTSHSSNIKSPTIVRSMEVTSFSRFDTWINFKHLELACLLETIGDESTTNTIGGQVFMLDGCQKVRFSLSLSLRFLSRIFRDFCSKI